MISIDYLDAISTNLNSVTEAYTVEHLIRCLHQMFVFQQTFITSICSKAPSFSIFEPIWPTPTAQ
jgi:hypothetical protein